MADFSISDLAQEFDVTPRTIRFYEDRGLLEPRRSDTGNRRRIYSQRDRTRLRLTLRGKRLGLTLAEIRELVDMYESPADTSQQLRRFLDVLQDHRRRLEVQLEDLQLTLAEIESHHARVSAMLDPQGQN